MKKVRLFEPWGALYELDLSLKYDEATFQLPSFHTGRRVLLNPTVKSGTGMDLLGTSNPFQIINLGHLYDVHLWTIPSEFRGFMVVFLILLAIAKTKTSIKAFHLGSFALYALWIGWRDLGIFLAVLSLPNSNTSGATSFPLALPPSSIPLMHAVNARISSSSIPNSFSTFLLVGYT